MAFIGLTVKSPIRVNGIAIQDKLKISSLVHFTFGGLLAREKVYSFPAYRFWKSDIVWVRNQIAARREWRAQEWFLKCRRPSVSNL
jgi:predicted acyltransferase